MRLSPQALRLVGRPLLGALAAEDAGHAVVPSWQAYSKRNGSSSAGNAVNGNSPENACEKWVGSSMVNS